MKSNPSHSQSPHQQSQSPDSTTEIRILADGSILAHNITPAMAKVLSEICPDDPALRQRSQISGSKSETG